MFCQDPLGLGLGLSIPGVDVMVSLCLPCFLSDRVFLFHLDVENQPFAFLDTRSSSNNEGNAEEELTYEDLFCVIVNLIVFKLYIFGEVLD